MKKVPVALKLAAVSIAAAMSLTACGNSASVQETAEKQSSSETVTKTEETASPNYWEMLNSVSDTSELPDWTGETLEVNVWVAGGTEYMFGSISDTNVTLKELERVTGVRFDVDSSFGNNGDSIDAKLPKMVASKQFPNLVYGWDVDSVMAELYENGYLVDLTEFYNNGSLDQIQYWMPTDVYGDTYYASMHDADGNYYLLPDYQGLTANFYNTSDYAPEEYDGQYYSTYVTSPVNATNQGSWSGVFIRDDILKALYPNALTMGDIEQLYLDEGIFTEDQIFDIPLNTTEDFFNLLRDIKKLLSTGDYVGLDGKPLEVTYGPNADTDNWNWMFNLPNFVNGNLTGVDYFTTIDNSATNASSLITRAFMTDSTISFMRGLNELVNEDVISQNSLVDNSASFDEKCLNGHYAVCYGDITNRPWNLDSGEDGWRYRPVYVKQELNTNYGGYKNAGRPGYWGIFKGSLSDEQIEQLVHAINYLQSEVGVKNFFWGPASAGLFEEDTDGVRTYTDAEVRAAMVEGQDNGAPVKYGLYCTTVSDQAFTTIPFGSAWQWFNYDYMHGEDKERTADEARTYFSPGILEGWSCSENSSLIQTDYAVYGFGATNVDGLKQFWSARAGFENQLKRTIATTTDSFEKELNNLLQYTIDNGMTDEALQEFGEKLYEANKNYLTNISAE